MHKGFHYGGNGDDENRERHYDGAGDLKEQDRLAHLPSTIKSWTDLRRGFRHYDGNADQKSETRLCKGFSLLRFVHISSNSLFTRKGQSKGVEQPG